MGGTSNFSFLEVQDVRLARLGALAERYFFDDTPSTLIKLRQFGELVAKDVAARQGLLPSEAATFDEVLRALKVKGADLILTNPPFGPAGGPPTRDDLTITDRVSSYRLPFVEHCIRALKLPVRCSTVSKRQSLPRPSEENWRHRTRRTSRPARCWSASARNGRRHPGGRKHAAGPPLAEFSTHAG